MKSFTQTDHNVLELFEDYVREWIETTFDRLTPPQRQAWPLIADGKNTLIFSPTGSGKTLAAFLFCINELFKLSVSNDLEDTIYVLYISPLRALSNDIHRNLYQPLRGIFSSLRNRSIHCAPIRSRVRTGDTTAAERAKMARKPPHILITTPETLYIILTTKKFRENLKNIQYVIVDEIHALAGSKRGVQLSLSLERLTAFLQRNPVRIGLSATQSPVEEIAAFLVGMENGVQRSCEIVDIGARKHLDLQVVSPVDNLLEAKNDVIWDTTYSTLIDMIKSHETTLIFTNSRYRTEHTALLLREMGEGILIGSHHGSMSRLIRHDVEEKLKHNQLDAVIATSSLELGIDVGSIDLVCNVESPKSLSSGMQRIGRAGHLLKETSKGRIVATDPDDLVEAAVLVNGIKNGIIDTTRIPFNALDILAQQIVACAAADDWDTTALLTLVRQSYCYHSLDRADFERILDMLSSQVSRNVYPKLFYDKVNKRITGTRGSRTIAFRCGGAIPDVSNYHVYVGAAKVGTLDEGFVERIRPGDVFILGSQAWQMTGLDKKKVLVRHVSGVPPTIPYWGGPRPSRTFDLGLLVGKFRRIVQEKIEDESLRQWLQSVYFLDEKGALAVVTYYKEQYMVLGCIPSDTHIVVESFKNELGNQQIAVHSPFGVKVNDMWGYALMMALQKENIQTSVATVDDGILLTIPEGYTVEPENLFALVTADFCKKNIDDIIIDSPVVSSRFRHCAVRSFLILREYAGKRVPVWLQNLRATELLEEFKRDKTFPVVKEALRESVEEAFDLPHLLEVLQKIEKNEIAVTFCETRIPSPFIHQLLLVGQFGDFGRISNEERKLRLIHLHRKVLKQLIDEDLIKTLLVEEEVDNLEKEAQFLMDHQKARSADELARIIQALGDVTTDEVRERVFHDADSLLEQLCHEKRVIQIAIPFGVPENRWIPTELYSLYRAAFATQGTFQIGILENKSIQTVTAEWIPAELRIDKDEGTSQREILKNFLEHTGPVTMKEVINRYGLPCERITAIFAELEEKGLISQGSFINTKESPQWCWRRTLEELHRRSLRSLREQVKPVTPHQYGDFMVKWQHVHPATRLKGKEGVYECIKQLQTLEEHITCWERYFLASRVSDYKKEYLDQLITDKKVSFGRFNPLPDHEQYILPRRGIIQLYCKEDAEVIVNNTIQKEYFEDLTEECAEIIDVLMIWPSLSFEGIVTGTQMERTRIARALLRLFQLGVIENDSYDSVRESTIISGMAAAWDLSHTPEDVQDADIYSNIRKKRICVDKGRWALLSRGVPVLLDRVRQLFLRYGIVTKELLRVNKEMVTPFAFVEACRILLLRGEIRQGRFIEGVEGIQYALPEAVAFLRDMTADDDFVVVNMKDPANLYGKVFPITDAEGHIIKHTAAAANHVIIKNGIVMGVITSKNAPSRYFNIELTILYDVSKEEMIALLNAVIAYVKNSALQKKFKGIRFVSFNGVSVTRSDIHGMLTEIGFSRERNKLVLPMKQEIKGITVDVKDIPEVFEGFKEAVATSS